MNYPAPPGQNQTPSASRTKKWTRSTLILLSISIPLIGAICCIGIPFWLFHQWQAGSDYGYLTVDDPRMTHPQHVGDTVTAGSMQMELSSLRHVNDEKGNTLLVMHVRFKELDPNHASYQVTTPGSFVVYNHPTFDREKHHYQGDALAPVDAAQNIPAEFANSRLQLDTIFLNQGETKEGDVLFNVPAKHGPLIFVWLPQGEFSAEQFAWTVRANDCALAFLDAC